MHWRDIDSFVISASRTSLPLSLLIFESSNQTRYSHASHSNSRNSTLQTSSSPSPKCSHSRRCHCYQTNRLRYSSHTYSPAAHSCSYSPDTSQPHHRQVPSKTPVSTLARRPPASSPDTEAGDHRTHQDHHHHHRLPVPNRLLRPNLSVVAVASVPAGA